MSSTRSSLEERMRELEKRLEEQEKRIQEQARTIEAERNAKEEERRAKEEEKREKEQEKREKEQERRAKEEERRAKEEERRKKEEEMRVRQEQTRKLEAIQKTMTPLPFIDFLQHMEEEVFSAFLIEPNPAHAASGTTTEVGGKMYPRLLRPWTDFPAKHMIAFNSLRDSFSDRTRFMSPISIEKRRKGVNPRRRIADEQDARSFIHFAIEEPAADIVTAYLKNVQPSPYREVRFQNGAYGRRPHSESPSKKQSQSRDLRPDRWTLLVTEADARVIVVAEYKPPNKLKAATVHRVLSAGPGDAFFPQAIRARQTEEQNGSAALALGVDVAEAGRVPGHVLVAQVLCQAYHYLIVSGCEYGYVSSGDSLVFLRVLADSPETLYYHSVSYNVPPIIDPDERRRLNAGRRAAHETAAAHIASLCLWAAETTTRSPAWIDAVKASAPRWPYPKKRVVGSGPGQSGNADNDSGSGSGDGSGGGDAGEGEEGAASGDGGGGGGAIERTRLPQPSGPLKRLRSPERRHRQADDNESGHMTAVPVRIPVPKAPVRPFSSYVLEPPTLPYCTQACLRGLVRGLPLDDGCPNAALHRAARQAARHVAGNGSDSGKAAGAADSHALTAAALRSRVVAQIAANMDKDCEALDRFGQYGRYGTLFKIAVTGYGYTFVGKSVEAADRDVLAQEAYIYDAIADLQGRLVPVCLGIVALERPIPLPSCIEVSHMLLLSYAGPNLCSGPRLLPQDVDLEAETYRSTLELQLAGVYNDDIRSPNLAWNAEVGRVMHFDFDQAWLSALPSPAVDLDVDVDEKPTPAEEEPCSPPPTAEADWNASRVRDDSQNRDQDQDQDQDYYNGSGRAKKRMRTAVTVKEEAADHKEASDSLVIVDRTA